MEYYKWAAYDTTGIEHTGAMRVRQWEEVAVKLQSRRLYPSSITKITINEYAHAAKAGSKLEKLYRVRNTISPPIVEIPREARIAKKLKQIIKWGIVSAVIIITALLLYVWWS